MLWGLKRSSSHCHRVLRWMRTWWPNHPWSRTWILMPVNEWLKRLTPCNNNSPCPNVSGRLDSKNKAMSSQKHTDRVKLRLKTHVRAISDTTTIAVTTHTSNGDSNSKDGSGVSSESGAKIYSNCWLCMNLRIQTPSLTVDKKALKTPCAHCRLWFIRGDTLWVCVSTLFLLWNVCEWLIVVHNYSIWLFIFCDDWC